MALFRSLLLALIGIGFGSSFAASASDLDGIAWPNFTHYGSRDGLPDAVLFDVLVDREGFVWAATQAGLYRYAGGSWEAFGPAATRGQIRDLHLDSSGRVWVGTDSAGIAIFSDDEWTLLGRAQGLLTDRIFRIAETDESGQPRLWIGTGDRGALRQRGTGSLSHPSPSDFELIDAKQGVVGEEVFAIARSEQLLGGPREWLGSFEGGLFSRPAPTVAEPTQLPWTRFEVGGFSASRIRDLRVLHEGDREVLWIATYGSGLYRFDGELVHYRRADGSLPSDLVYEVAETTVGGVQSIWAATKGGLIRIRDGVLTRFDRNHGLPFDAVRSVNAWPSPDGIQLLWVGTESGISRGILNDGSFATVSTLGAAGNGVWSVLVEPHEGKERLWVAAAFDGVLRYQDGRWHDYPETRQFGGSNVGGRLVKSILDAEGVPRVFVATWGGAVYQVGSDDELRRLEVPWTERDGEVVLDAVSLRSPDGAFEQWFALRESGLYGLREGRWQHHVLGPKGVQSRLSGLIEQRDANGRNWLWASSYSGLWRYDGSQWQHVEDGKQTEVTRLLGGSLVRVGERTELWTGSIGAGVRRFDVSHPEQPAVITAALPPSPHPTVFGVIADGQGRVYVCSNRGVQRLTAAASGYTSEVFYKSDGLVHDECNTGSMHIDDQERLWIGSLGGLSVLTPRTARGDMQAKPLLLRSVVVDGQIQALEQSLRLPSHYREVGFEFALLSWKREQQSAFRTQLIGYDPLPSDWSSEPRRRFGKLPVGDYTLQIEARDYAGRAAKPIRIAISVQPTWWETTAAKVLGSGAAVLLFGLAVRWASRRQRLRASQLALLVEQRTAELNQALRTVEALSLRDELTQVGNRRHVLRQLEHLAADGQAGVLGLILFDVDLFKSYNDRYGHPAGDRVLTQVASAVQVSLGGRGELGRYGGEEFLVAARVRDADALVALAEELRAAVEGLTMEHAEAPLGKLTISAGCACERRASAQTQRLLDRADRALYVAKQAGRNCVRLDVDSEAA